MAAETTAEPRRANVVVVSAGVSDPSSTRMLADRLAQATIESLSDSGFDTRLAVIELAPLAVDIARATVAGFASDTLQESIAVLAEADAVIAAVPVYKAGVSGLFKSFFDVLDSDLLLAKPVALAATAGSALHGSVPDEQLRPLLAYFRALTIPTSVFATPQDWADTSLSIRIERAAAELASLVTSGVEKSILRASRDRYQHQFAGAASGAEKAAGDVDFTTDLMKLAAGGQSPPAGGVRHLGHHPAVSTARPAASSPTPAPRTA